MKNAFTMLIMSVFLIGTAFSQDDNSTDPLSAAELAEQKNYYDLESAMADPDKVFKLVLDNQKLKKFPPEILTFKNLQALSLRNNKLKEIPSEIGELRNLQRLNLNGNKLKDVPQAVMNNHALEVLKVGYNRIWDVPEWIGRLSNLKRLELSGNRLEPAEMNKIKPFFPTDCFVTY